MCTRRHVAAAVQLCPWGGAHQGWRCSVRWLATVPPGVPPSVAATHDDAIRRGDIRPDPAQTTAVRKFDRVLQRVWAFAPDKAAHDTRVLAARADAAAAVATSTSARARRHAGHRLLQARRTAGGGTQTAAIAGDDGVGVGGGGAGRVDRLTSIPRGLYLWGSVGTGKSMLMNLVHDSLHDSPIRSRRVHFHQFMLDVHDQVHRHKRHLLETYGRDPVLSLAPEKDALTHVAHTLADAVTLLCFDEFQVTDVADALILSKLFGVLFSRGVVVLATSNQPPSELYKGGLNRTYFLPFIDLLQAHCRVHDMASGVDHRLHLGCSGTTTYMQPASGAAARSHFAAAVDRVVADAGRHADDAPLVPLSTSFGSVLVQEQDVPVMMGRSLRVTSPAPGVALMSFGALCGSMVGAADFQALCRHCTTLLLYDVPHMTPGRHNEVRRFVTLIDEVYEHGVALHCLAADLPHNLFVPLMANPAAEEDAGFGGALWHSVDASLLSSSVEDSALRELRFASRRAVSRLVELCRVSLPQ